MLYSVKSPKHNYTVNSVNFVIKKQKICLEFEKKKIINFLIKLKIKIGSYLFKTKLR